MGKTSRKAWKGGKEKKKGLRTTSGKMNKKPQVFRMSVFVGISGLRGMEDRSKKKRPRENKINKRKKLVSARSNATTIKMFVCDCLCSLPHTHW